MLPSPTWNPREKNGNGATETKSDWSAVVAAIPTESSGTSVRPLRYLCLNESNDRFSETHAVQCFVSTTRNGLDGRMDPQTGTHTKK